MSKLYHHPPNRERALNLSILTVSGPGAYVPWWDTRKMTVNISLISARENVGRKTVKTLNLPLHRHALHIIVQKNDDQLIKKNIRLKFPEFCKIFKLPEFSLQGIFISHFPCFPVLWYPVRIIGQGVLVLSYGNYWNITKWVNFAPLGVPKETLGGIKNQNRRTVEKLNRDSHCPYVSTCAMEMLNRDSHALTHIPAKSWGN